MSQYAMPKVQKGDPVLWHVDGQVTQTSGDPGVVLCVHPEMIDIATLVQGSNVVVHLGVRHVTDPRLTTNKNARAVQKGGWDHSPLVKEVQNLKQALSDLAKSKK